MKLFGGNNSDRNAIPEKRATRAAKSGDTINSAKSGNNTSKKKTEKPKHRGRGALIALAVVVLIVGGVYLYWIITTQAPDVGGNDPSAPEGEEAGVTAADHQEGVHTLLVVGNDQEGFNTDTMMVMKYDSVNKTANAVSLPRDTMVNFDKVKKLNAVYFNEGGIDALMDAVEDIVGFRPDHYIVVDTNCFVKVVDAMGGIYFDVPQDMDYDDYSDKDHDGVDEYVFNIHVKAGYQLLSGYDALGVFRYRDGYAMGDIQRLGVQHDLLMAAAEQFMGTRNLFKLYQAASIILDNSDTDLTYGNLQWYAQQFLGLSIEDISISTMPTTGTWVHDTTYVAINVDEWIAMLNETINPLTKQISKQDCSIVYWTVTPTLKGNQYYSQPEDFATTDGTDMYTNFPTGN
jgi:LCP family protein required for cell wall assembly